MKPFIFFIFIITFLNGCASDNTFEIGKEELIRQGFTHITHSGWVGFCCSNDTLFNITFICRNDSNKRVSGYMCIEENQECITLILE